MCQCTIKDNPVVVTIDKTKLMQGDPYAVSLFAFGINPNGVEEKLRMIGIEFESNPLDDLLLLSNLHIAGGDVEGVMEDVDGNVIKFDFIKLLKSVRVDTSYKNPIKIELV